MSLVETAALVTNGLVLLLLLVSMAMSGFVALLFPAFLTPPPTRDRNWSDVWYAAGIFVVALFVLIFSMWAFDNAPAWAWSEHIQTLEDER